MAIKVRVRNGMRVDSLTGLGGASEGDWRGNYADVIDFAGVPNIVDDELVVHESDTPGMSVVLEPGVGYVPNADFDPSDSDSIKFWEAVVEEEETLTIDANTSGQDRVDLVCLKMDLTEITNNDASNVVTAVIVKGTPGAGAPSTPDNYLALYEVLVEDATPDIQDADLTDVRVQVQFKPEVVPTRIRRTTSIVSASSITPNFDTTDQYAITALAANLTINAPTGTPVNDQSIIIRIKDAGVAKTLTWNSVWREIGVNLPSSTTTSKTVYIGGKWNSTDNKIDVIYVGEEN